MKRFIIILLSLCFALSACVGVDGNDQQTTTAVSRVQVERFTQHQERGLKVSRESHRKSVSAEQMHRVIALRNKKEALRKKHEAARAHARYVARVKREAEINRQHAEAHRVATARDASQQSASPSENVSVSGAAACIAKYESGGNPTAQNPSSSASGLYQFLDTTWQAVTGRSDRAMDAPVSVQTAAFYELWAGGAGASQWVTAGRCGY